MSMSEKNAQEAERRAAAAVGTSKEAKLAAKATKAREFADYETGRRERAAQDKQERTEAKQVQKAAAEARQQAADAHAQELKDYIRDHKSERLGRFDSVHVFPDRIIKSSWLDVPESHPLAGVSAEVEESGGVNSRTTLTRSLVIPTGGWQKKNDNRTAYLIVNGPDFQWSVRVAASGASGELDVRRARQFAASLTGWGRQAVAPAGGAAVPEGSSDLAEQLSKLADLHTADALTDAEYEAAKAHLLN